MSFAACRRLDRHTCGTVQACEALGMVGPAPLRRLPHALAQHSSYVTPVELPHATRWSICGVASVHLQERMLEAWVSQDLMMARRQKRAWVHA